MLSYEEFKQEVVDNIKDYMTDRFKDAEVSITEVTKNNDTRLDGLQIRLDDQNYSPTIYLNSLFERYEETGDLESIMEKIASSRENASLKLPISVEDLSDLDKVRDRIDCKVLSAERNQAYLQDKPHHMVEDLATVYTINLGGSPDGFMNAVVTDGILSRWGISADELHDIAISNMERLSPIEIENMQDMLFGMMIPEANAYDHSLEAFTPREGEAQMYVLSNHDKMFGAKAILNTEAMDLIAEKLGGDFIVLPSSVHETLILPHAETMDRAALEDMVQQVNANEVSAQEVLSDHVYCYDAKAHELVRAETYQERQNEKTAEKTAQKEEKGLSDKKADKSEHKEAQEKKSIKERIAEKKEIAAKLNPEKSAPTKSLQATL